MFQGDICLGTELRSTKRMSLCQGGPFVASKNHLIFKTCALHMAVVLSRQNFCRFCLCWAQKNLLPDETDQTAPLCLFFLQFLALRTLQKKQNHPIASSLIFYRASTHARLYRALSSALWNQSLTEKYSNPCNKNNGTVSMNKRPKLKLHKKPKF